MFSPERLVHSQFPEAASTTYDPFPRSKGMPRFRYASVRPLLSAEDRLLAHLDGGTQQTMMKDHNSGLDAVDMENRCE